jgi:hypothetical protein
MALPLVPIVLGGTALKIGTDLFSQSKQDAFRRKAEKVAKKRTEEEKQEMRRRQISSLLGVSPGLSNLERTPMPTAPNLDVARTLGAIGQLGASMAAFNIANTKIPAPMTGSSTAPGLGIGPGAAGSVGITQTPQGGIGLGTGVPGLGIR